MKWKSTEDCRPLDVINGLGCQHIVTRDFAIRDASYKQASTAPYQLDCSPLLLTDQLLTDTYRITYLPCMYGSADVDRAGDCEVIYVKLVRGRIHECPRV